MKQIKSIALISLVIMLTIFKGKTQVSDTTQYLIDRIQSKASYYVGKPLKALLQDLQIQPVCFDGIVFFTEHKGKDTIDYEDTRLNFYSNNTLVSRMYHGIKSPSIYIKFAQPIPIPKTWFMRGGRFEKWDWDLQKERFFRNFIVGEIGLRGI
jgi:hypothetical protein